MNNQIVNNNLIYLTIPKDWINTYYKLLYLLSIEGKNIIDDCNYNCSNKGHNVFTCWNLFQSALAAYAIKDYKKANLFLEYIDKQLEIYANRDKIKILDFKDIEPRCAYEIQSDGTYKVIISMIIDGKEVVKTLDMSTVSAHILYYGWLNTSDYTNVNIEVLTKKELNSIDETITVHPDETNKYVWFVSDVELEFTESNFPVDLNKNVIGNLYYYHTDALNAGTSTYKVKQKE